MAIEIPRHEVSLKEEGLAHLFRADPKKFGRGISAAAKSSVTFEVPIEDGIIAMASHVIKSARERFPGNPDLEGKDFEVGAVIGAWIAMKEFEVGLEENPHLAQHFAAQKGITV